MDNIMAGIVSLVDSETSRKVIEIRRQLDDELDVQAPIQNHLPHFSYQVGEYHDNERVSEVIQGLANEKEPFIAHTNGIGVFSDSDPLIVYIPVIRDSHLSGFQSQVWEKGKTAGTDFQDYYRPNRWTPHITIAPVERDELPSVMDLLSGYSFYWDVEIDNIATIQGDAPNRRVDHQTSFSEISSSE